MSEKHTTYLVPLGTAEYKLTVKGSKFIGVCSSAHDESDAVDFIKSHSRQFHSATHNCWAYRIGDPSSPVERSSDEGEPTGTAGRPILEQLIKTNLVGAVLIVSRWFGGTKLGKGGLVRAYGGCAAETIRLLKTQTRQPEVRITVECSYDLVGLVERTASKCKGSIEGGDYSESARLNVKLPLEMKELFGKLISEDSAGKVRIGEIRTLI